MKLLKIILSIWIVMFAQTYNAIGQNDTYKSPVPIAPNAASLGKYVEIPVGLYTGIPQINLPIENLKGRELNLDISLSYHASGFRVDEDATSVGLGWSLNAGGVITRIVRGEVDSKTRVPVPAFFDIPWSYLFELTQTQWYDNQPDMYYYNFNGISGVFYLSNIGVPIINDDNNLIIDPIFNSTNDIIKWKIINTKGESFVFGESENVDYTLTQPVIYRDDQFFNGTFELQPTESSPTAYYLTTIKTADGTDSIKFEYNKESYKYVTELSYSQDYSIGGDLNGPSYPVYTNIWMDSKRLKSIQNPNWKVTFDCPTTREDLNYFNDQVPKAISEIQIYEGSSKLMKRIHFYTSYFVSTGWNTAPEIEKFRYKRLRLDSLAIFSPDLSLQIPATKFTYNATILPAKYTTAQDLWGFYNGKVANPVQLLPNIKDFYFLPVGYNDPRIVDINGGSDRDPYGEFMKACSITEIQYPTGGKHQFIFEPNFYSKEIHAITNHTLYTGFSGYETSELLYTNSEVFNIPSNQEVVDIIFEYRIATKSYTSGYGTCLINGNPFQIDLPTPTNASSFLQHFPTTFLHTGTNNLNVTAFHGNSKLTIRLRDKNSSYQNTIAGGLRILQTTVLDPTTNTSLMTNYEYTIHDPQTFLNTGISSGSIVTEPVYISTYLKPLNETVFAQVLKLSPTSNINLGSTQGGYVGYQEVKVTKNAGSNGSEIYFHTSAKQFPDKKIIKYGGMDATSQLLDLHSFTDLYFVNSGLKLIEPFVPLACTDFKRGLLTKKIALNSSNIPVQKEEYLYNFEKLDSISGIKIIARHKWVYEFGMWFNKLVRIDYNTYKEIVGKKMMTGKIVTNYFLENNSSSVITNSYSYYNNPILLTDLEETYSGKTVITSYKYAKDYSNNITNMSNLIASNLVTLPIKIEKSVSGKQIEGTIIEYDNYGRSKNLYKYESNALMPPYAHDQNFILPFSLLYKLKLTCMYDTKGNLLEAVKGYGQNTSYLWGYNYTFPIVKVEGKAYNDISSNTISNIANHIFSNGITYASTKTDVEYLKVQLASLMNDSKAMVTFYTYAPLVGMTSQTDPKGITTYYEYNQMMQLERILDDKANIKKEYKYHYYNQPSPLAIDYYVNPALSLLTYIQAGGTQSVIVSSNASLTITKSASWITVSPSSLIGNGTLSIVCSSNSGAPRSGTVTLQSSSGTGNITKVITINQSGTSAYITASPSALDFEATAVAQTVTVSSSPTWSVLSTTGSYITATKSTETSLSISCSKNTGAARTGSVTLTNGTTQATISVWQNCVGCPPR
jgi:hypothetical protein